jgi:coenzyme F420-reducing hydrogenase delta subunit
MFDTNELAMIWFALVLEQKEYEEGSKNWWRRERLIRKVEKELGMSERPLVKEVKDES